jgi:hypothetical protein
MCENSNYIVQHPIPTEWAVAAGDHDLAALSKLLITGGTSHASLPFSPTCQLNYDSQGEEKWQRDD